MRRKTTRAGNIRHMPAIERRRRKRGRDDIARAVDEPHASWGGEFPPGMTGIDVGKGRASFLEVETNSDSGFVLDKRFVSPLGVLFSRCWRTAVQAALQ